MTNTLYPDATKQEKIISYLEFMNRGYCHLA